MGLMQSWLAGRNVDLNTWLAKLGWTDTGVDEDYGPVDGLFHASAGPWTVLVADGDAHFLSIPPDTAEKLPAEAALSFMTAEMMAMSETVYYEQGRLVWRVAYNGSRGASTTDVSGTLPPEVAARLAESPYPDDHPRLAAEVVTGFSSRGPKKVRGCGAEGYAGAGASACDTRTMFPSRFSIKWLNSRSKRFITRGPGATAASRVDASGRASRRTEAKRSRGTAPPWSSTRVRMDSSRSVCGPRADTFVALTTSPALLRARRSGKALSRRFMAPLPGLMTVFRWAFDSTWS